MTTLAQQQREVAPSGGGAIVLDGDSEELARLRQQSAGLRAHAEVVCERADVQAGHRVLHLGCGPGGILDVLSERVGPTGEVVGMDVQPLHVAQAREFVASRGLTNVTILEGDAHHVGFPNDFFDVVYGGLILVNDLDAIWAVAEMVRLVKPGGSVVGQEVDALFLCEPTHPAVDRLAELLRTCFARAGADLHVGRRVPAMYRANGLTEVGVDVLADAQSAGHPRRPIQLDLLRAMKETAVRAGFIGSGEYEALDRAARAHLDDPSVVVVPALYFLCWGRKPPARPRSASTD